MRFKEFYTNSLDESSNFEIKVSKKDKNWVFGNVGGYYFEAQIYDEPSHFGIEEGKISKLFVKDKISKQVILSYDRGWDIEPKTSVHKKILKTFLDNYK